MPVYRPGASCCSLISIFLSIETDEKTLTQIVNTGTEEQTLAAAIWEPTFQSLGLKIIKDKMQAMSNTSVVFSSFIILNDMVIKEAPKIVGVAK